jgi:broad specificity phosphatase PhoE
MPRDLILIRHGEPEHHADGSTGGWTDSLLTSRGRDQAEATGMALVSLCKKTPIVFFSSDLLRAKATAQIIAKHIGMDPMLCSELRELNNGTAKDKTPEEAAKIALPLTTPTVDWVPYPEAESWRMMTDRITGFLRTAIEPLDTHRVLIVSHGNAMVAIVHWWLRLEEAHWSSVSYRFDFGSITHLSANEWGERLIVKLNDTSHLQDKERLEPATGAYGLPPAAQP